MCFSPLFWQRRRLGFAFALIAVAVASTRGAAAPLSFAEVTSAAGVSYTQHELRARADCLLLSSGFPFCEAERQSGGAAAGDADGDGRIDLFVTRNDDSDLLFRNLGDGGFEDITEESGLGAFVLQSNGAAWVDIDRDGDLDLYVTTIGMTTPNDRFHLFVNDGQAHFTEQATPRGAALPGGGAGTSVAVGDYDRDGWPDLFVTEWLPDTAPTGPAGQRNRLLRNRGSEAPGHFEDVTEAAGISILLPVNGGEWGFAATLTDVDADGWPDLLVAADFDSSHLFWNRGDGTFEEATESAGVGGEENGMGSTLGDFDGDGDLDWFVTSIFDDDGKTEGNWGETGNRLYRNEGGRSFSDATDAAGVRDGSWGWGSAFFDADNDGDLDLTMTNGVIYTEGLEDDQDQQFHADPMRFWQNDGSGAMTEQGSLVGLDDSGPGKGLLVFDYDQDGDLDLFLVNNGTGGRLFRNESGNQNDWLRVEVLASAPATPALGARVELIRSPGENPQLRLIGSAGHFLGQSEATAHFGLGPAPGGPVHEIRITWPTTGRVEVLRNIARNQLITLPEPSTHASRLIPVLALLAIGSLRQRRTTSRSKA